jgi:uncharacterized protein YdeI (YjbR/CyaY-like superfamily)
VINSFRRCVIDITDVHHASDLFAWRTWLERHHAQSKAIWLVTDKRVPNISYLEAVEEALCFGWIDGIAKRIDPHCTAQRFTPRRANSHWTELNKERARRLIVLGRMTDAGCAVLPDLSLEAFRIAPDIQAALRADPQTWHHFQAFPDLYQRIRIGYIEEMRRNQPVFESRLRHFLERTRQNKQFGGIR